MITKDDLRAHFEKLLHNIIPGDLQAINQKMVEYLTYSIQHYDKLDEEAKKFTDASIEAVEKYNAQLLSQLPDGKIKRQLSRLHASSMGKHFDIEAHVNELESSPKKIDDNLKECVKIFTEGLKHISDLIFDVTQNIIQDSANFAQLSLLIICVNELLVTLHLLKHRYVNQAYSHIRTIFENLEKVELFRIKPQWADVWAGNDEKKKRDELRPVKVREKLGKEKHDPIYSLFSSLGVHGTFQAVQVQVVRKVKKKEERPSFTAFVGGTPFEHNIVGANGFGIYALYSVLLQLMRSFKQYLNVEEGEEILLKIFNEFKSYTNTHFLSWAKKANLKTGDLELFLENATRDSLIYDK